MITGPRSTSLPSRYPSNFPTTQVSSTHTPNSTTNSINHSSWRRTASRSRRHSSYATTYSFRPSWPCALWNLYWRTKRQSAPAALRVATRSCTFYVSSATRPSTLPSTITRGQGLHSLWWSSTGGCAETPTLHAYFFGVIGDPLGVIGVRSPGVPGNAQLNLRKSKRAGTRRNGNRTEEERFHVGFRTVRIKYRTND